jgi:hypothetical protein
MNPWVLVGILVSALSLFGSGYALGTHHADNACVAGQAKSKEVAQAESDNESTRREGIGTERETSREKIRIVYRTIKEKASEDVKNNPAYNACGLDADGLRGWNASNAGETSPLLGKLDYRLSSTATGSIGKVDGLVPQPHRGDGVVHAMPGSAP